MTKTLRYVAIALLAVPLAGHPGFADEGGIRVDQVWARATPASAKTGAIYFSVTNSGAATDRLVAASTPVAEKAELHEMTMKNDIMEMRPVPALAIEPGKSVILEPDGYHLMLIGLKAPLKEGDKLPLTLTFEHAGNQQVTVTVAKISAMHEGEMSGGPATPAGSAKPSMSTMPGMPR